MVSKVVILFVCLVAVCGYVTCGPVLPKTKQEMMESFVEFLKEDKQFGAVLEKLSLENGISRTRRQADETASVEGNTGGDTTDLDPPKDEGGFFDRAAKFVMEVLQRFLKWINSDN